MCLKIKTFQWVLYSHISLARVSSPTITPVSTGSAGLTPLDNLLINCQIWLTSGNEEHPQAGDQNTRQPRGGQGFAQEQPGQDGGEHLAQADQGIGVTQLCLGQHDEPHQKSQAVTQQTQEHVEVGGRS